MKNDSIKNGLFNDDHSQAFSIHTVPVNNDKLLLSYLEYYDQVQNAALTDPDVIEISRSLQPTFERLSSILNMDISSLENFGGVAETIVLRKQLNQPLPPELSSLEIYELNIALQKSTAIIFHKRVIGALLSNTLIKELDKNIDNAKNNNLKKFVLYSGHDVTIMGLMSALGVPLQYSPGYASHMSVLLFVDDNDGSKYSIKFLFNNQEINIPDCQNNTYCTYSEFKNLVEKIKSLAQTVPV